jgi:sugar transferase EpsL
VETNGGSLLEGQLAVGNEKEKKKENAPMTKRIFDFLASLISIILLSPIFIIIAAAIKISSKGPVIFKQERAGKEGKSFTLFKFRTMKNLYDDSGGLLADERRITPVGKLLRKLSLDELPQFFNVLKGDMSIVGPRPLLMEYVPLYNKKQEKRLLVQPGITGWAQVNGRNAITWEQKFAYDVWYVENRSLGLDFKIMFMTFLEVFKGEGISAEGYATMPVFTGTPETGTENKNDDGNTNA